MLSSVATFALSAVDSSEVTVEVDLRRGLTTFSIVGLPDTAVREARERVRAALLNSEFDFPKQRVTVNLAPANMRKGGPGFDLAIASAILAASDQVPPHSLARTAVCGELSLGGSVRPIRGALAMAIGARECGFERLIVPRANAPEAALVDGIEVLGIETVAELVRMLRGNWRPDPVEPREPRPPTPSGDLAEVRGQSEAKRALEIAAAGGHNLLMKGPPGAGKTMLARRLRGILPPPDFDEAVEITRIHSIAGLSDGRLASERPFRAPHHTISAPGLIGGGNTPRAGEITLAHRGVLFMDEVAEFSRASLEALRQPLETGVVEVMRGNRWATLPARTMLVAACNNCGCGRAQADCTCTAQDIHRYESKLSAPLVDRIDLICSVSLPSAAELERRAPTGERTDAVLGRVIEARERQSRRFAELVGVRANADMDGPATRAHVDIGDAALDRLAASRADGGFSARAHDRVLRVARTIADLEGSESVGPAHVDEALHYRMPELAVPA